MDQKLPGEDIIRRYLLGALAEPELSEIEQKLLSSEELSQTAELIEDEIIEQYLDGDLDDRDKNAVETHFLRPPAHREKLRFARLLRHHFQLAPAEAQHGKDRLLPHTVQRLSLLWTYGASAAAVLLGASSLYLGMVQYGLKNKVANDQKTQAVLRAELKQEQVLSANLREKLQGLQTSTTSVVALELRPGVMRGSDPVPKATIQTTRLIKVDLLLPYAASTSFRVQLVGANREQVLWSKTGLKPIPAPPLSRMVFEFPVSGVKPGPYTLVVSREPNHSEEMLYPFDIGVSQ
jgi:hypothetical protein